MLPLFSFRGLPVAGYSLVAGCSSATGCSLTANCLVADSRREPR
uniref:Uncharacterized protein n=1 Tax=Arundo donax TaxID=35708 RepID=A0A0A9B206_ARUDO